MMGSKLSKGRWNECEDLTTTQGTGTGRGWIGDNGRSNEPVNNDDRDDDQVSVYYSASEGDLEEEDQNRVLPESRMDPNRPRKLQSIQRSQGFSQLIDNPPVPPGLMSKWLPSWYSQYQQKGYEAIPGTSTSGRGGVHNETSNPDSLNSSTADESEDSSRRDDPSMDVSSDEPCIGIGGRYEPDLSPSTSVTSLSSEPEDFEVDDDVVYDNEEDLSFKEKLISRIERRKKGLTSMRREADDPRNQLDYNRSTDNFTVGGIRVYLQKKSLLCTICDRRFEGNSISPTWNARMHNLEKAITTHVNGKHLDAFKCKVCGKSLSCFYSWQQHMDMHLKKFVCKICGEPKRSRLALKRHELTHMNDTERKNWMVRNGKSAELTRQQQSARIFKCLQCPKTFAVASYLQQHVRMIHENRKKVRCPDCRKLVLEQNYRRYHRVFVCPDEDHQNIQRVQCPLCIDTFKTDNTLRNHMRKIHAVHRKNALKNNGKYGCTICRKTFTKRRALTQHTYGAHQKKNK